MADDDDAIYVDVKARLDEASADEAAGKLRDKFKDAAQGLGESIRDSTRSMGENIKDAFDKYVIRDVEDTGRELKGAFDKYIVQDFKDTVQDLKGIGSGIKDYFDRDTIDSIRDGLEGILQGRGGIGGAGGGGGGGLKGLGDALSGLKDSLRGGGADGLRTLKDALAGLREGDIPVEGIKSALDGVVDPKVIDKYDALNRQFQDTKGNLKDIVEIMGGAGAARFLPFVAPVAAGAVIGREVSEPATELPLIRDRMRNPDGSPAWLNPDGTYKSPIDRWISHQPIGSWLLPPHDLPAPKPTGEGVDRPIGERLGPMFLGGQPDPRMVAPRPGESPTQTFLGTVAAPPVARAPAPTVVQAPAAAPTSAGAVSISASVANISAGSVNLSGGISIPAISSTPSAQPSTASNSATGGTFARDPTGGVMKHSRGGILPGDSPGYDNLLGQLPGGKPVSLEGGEFVVNPDATQANLGLLQSINAGPHFDEGGQVPQGAVKQDPIGSGKGLGVSGGAIGAAESMASMFPGASIAMQEANLAVQKGGQMLATLAMAPIETMWLGGGQMGAPSVGSPAHAGWMGKLMSGMVGQQTNLPNIAGAVQPPKDQAQKPGEQEPEGVNKAPAPSGTKDDPLHTKNVAHAPGPPQGAPTSAASMNASALVQASPA